MSTFLKVAVGLIVGVLLCVGGLRLLIMQQERKSVDAAPTILKQQFSSANLSSEELALVVKRGYRARLWPVLSGFLKAEPTYDRAIEVLGPPDEELRDDELAKLRGEERLGEGAANVRILYKVGQFDLTSGEPAKTFSVIEVYFRGTTFAVWNGAGLYLDDPLATSTDSRIEGSEE